MWIETAVDVQGPSDEELLRRTLTQDRGAFRTLFERYQSRVYNTALRITANREDAADLLQDVFLTVYTQARTFRFQSKFSTWLMSVTIHAAINAVKRSRIRSHAPLSDDSAAPASLDPLRDRRIQEALNRLDPLTRSVVVLRYIEGMNYAEIAQVLGCPFGTVQSRLNRAHRKLRDLLRKENNEVSDGR